MRKLTYLLIGIFFGIVLFKSEAASWFRIYEMFRFESFHMYGIMGTALALGIAGIKLIKKQKIHSFHGDPIVFIPKEPGFARYIYGGIIFGLGWALAGACPGPMFVLFGAGFMPILLEILFALVGTFVYGLLRDRLPH